MRGMLKTKCRSIPDSQITAVQINDKTEKITAHREKDTRARIDMEFLFALNIRTTTLFIVKTPKAFSDKES